MTNTLMLTCMDKRLVDPIPASGRALCDGEFYHPATAGAGLCLTRRAQLPWFFENVRLFQDDICNGDAITVVLANHLDCGAAKKFGMPASQGTSFEVAWHAEQLGRGMKYFWNFAERERRQVGVRAIMLDNDGSCVSEILTQNYAPAMSVSSS